MNLFLKIHAGEKGKTLHYLRSDLIPKENASLMKFVTRKLIMPYCFEDKEGYNCYYQRILNENNYDLDPMRYMFPDESRWCTLLALIWIDQTMRRNKPQFKPKQTIEPKIPSKTNETNEETRQGRWSFSKFVNGNDFKWINEGKPQTMENYKSLHEICKNFSKFRFKRNFVFTLLIMLRKSKIVKDIFLEKIYYKLINYFSMTSPKLINKAKINYYFSMTSFKNNYINYKTMSVPKYINISSNMEDEMMEDPINIQLENYLDKLNTAYLYARADELENLLKDKLIEKVDKEKVKEYKELIKYMKDLSKLSDEEQIKKIEIDETQNQLRLKEEWKKENEKDLEIEQEVEENKVEGLQRKRRFVKIKK
jgi:hypothetical protein